MVNNLFPQLHVKSVVSLMTTANKLGIQINDVTNISGILYPKKWHNVSTQELFKKYGIGNNILNDSTSKSSG